MEPPKIYGGTAISNIDFQYLRKVSVVSEDLIVIADSKLLAQPQRKALLLIFSLVLGTKVYHTYMYTTLLYSQKTNQNTYESNLE